MRRARGAQHRRGRGSRVVVGHQARNFGNRGVDRGRRVSKGRRSHQRARDDGAVRVLRGGVRRGQRGYLHRDARQGERFDGGASVAGDHADDDLRRGYPDGCGHVPR